MKINKAGLVKSMGKPFASFLKAYVDGGKVSVSRGMIDTDEVRKALEENIANVDGRMDRNMQAVKVLENSEKEWIVQSKLARMTNRSRQYLDGLGERLKFQRIGLNKEINVKSLIEILEGTVDRDYGRIARLKGWLDNLEKINHR